MKRCDVIRYEDTTIVVVDAAHATSAEVVQILEEGRRLVATFPLKSVRLLTDATEASYSTVSIAALRVFATRNSPFILASAVIGLDGIRTMALNQIRSLTGRPIRAFSCREYAVAWLAEQGEPVARVTHILSLP